MAGIQLAGASSGWAGFLEVNGLQTDQDQLVLGGTGGKETFIALAPEGWLQQYLVKRFALAARDIQTVVFAI